MAASRRRTTGAPLFTFIAPLDPTPVDAPPGGDAWVHEIKWDGYRAQAHVGRGEVKVFSRAGADWTGPFGTICRDLQGLAAEAAVLDGEAVYIGRSGRPDFQALRRELGKKAARIRYYAFDLLMAHGEDLRDLPLLERKRRLRALLQGLPSSIVYVEHMKGDSRRIVEHACQLGLEGIVSKRADSPYRAGRRATWLKSKCELTDSFPIVAFVEKLGARPRRIASLYVGRRDGDKLLYAGKVASGFTLASQQEVREALDPHIRRASPLSEPVDKPKATWLAPVVDAEIAFSSRTDRGLLRHPVFKGLREDLAPARPRRTASARGVPPYNILQRLTEGVAPGEADLVAYWTRVAPQALPHLARRPLKLVRRVGHTIFYHKGPLPPVPGSVRQLTLDKREGGEGVRLWVEDLAGLLGLVQEVGAVELHPWNATVDDIEQADRLVIDLDPGSGVAWSFVQETALQLRALLEQAGLAPWPKLTGGKGLHLMAPLPERMPHDQAHALSRAVVERIARRDPQRYTTSAVTAQRTGRLFLDYLRNGRGTTAVGAWSPRARPGFPIARPVTWRQVESGIGPDAYAIDHPFRRSKRAAR